MSIQSEINRISQNVSDSLTAVAAKGVTVPTGSTSDDLPELISQISSGSGSAITITDELDSHGGTIRTISAVSLAGDTVRPDVLLSGYTAHNALGEAITGTASSGGTPNLQTKSVSISPSETAQSQTVTADSWYDGLDEVSVSVEAVSSTYVGSGITRRSSTDLTASGATVTVPSGYYSSQGTKSVSAMTLPTSTSSSASSGYSSKATVSRSTSDQYINIPTGYNSSGAYYKVNAVANGSVTAPSTISGTSATVSTGTNTLTLTKSVSVTPNVTTAGYISSGTAGNASVSLSASVTTQGAQTIHPSTSNQTISSGRYLTGTQTINAVTLSNLTADNIKSGVVVKVGDSSDDDCVTSVTGTYSGGGGSSKNVQIYYGSASRTANSYGATSVTLTVAKTGTYKISWCAWRGSSSGTMGTNLHIGDTSGTNQQTWTGTYGQIITLNNQSLTKDTVLTLYASSGSNSRTVYVGNLIIEEQ